MINFFQDFAHNTGLTFKYEYDDVYGTHRFIFMNPGTQKRWAYMIHTDELKNQESRNHNGFINFIINNVTKLI